MSKLQFFYEYMRTEINEPTDLLLSSYLLYKKSINKQSINEIVKEINEKKIQNIIMDIADQIDIEDIYNNFKDSYTSNDWLEIFMSSENLFYSPRFGSYFTQKHINQVILSQLPTDKNLHYAEFGSGIGNTMIELVRFGIRKITLIEISIKNYAVTKLRATLLCEIHNDLEVEIILDDVFNYSKENPDKKFDVVISDFPWNIRMNEDINSTFEGTKFEDIRFSKISDWKFIALTIIHSNYSIVIAPPKFEYAQPDDAVREFVLRNGFFKKIIQLPSNTMVNTIISPLVIVFSKNNEMIEFIDASNTYHEIQRKNILTKEDVELINQDNFSNKYTIALSDVLESGRLLPSYYGVSKIKNGLKIEEDCEVIRGYNFKKTELNQLISDVQTSNILIRTSHLSNGTVKDPVFLKNVPENIPHLKDGDILITRVGSTVETAIYESEDENIAIVDQSLLVLRLDKNKIYPYYVLAFLQSKLGKEHLQNLYSGTVISQLSVSNLKTMILPNETMKEQIIIGNRLRDNIKKIIEKQLELDILIEENSEQLNAWFKEEM